MANTAASVLITRTLDSLSRISTGTTRSGITLENLSISWLNTVQYRMSRIHDFREMFKRYTASTAASQKTYSFPTDFKVIISMAVIDGSSSTKLTMVLPSRFDKVIPYPENWTIRRPRWYVPFGTDFDLYPIPDATYTLNCRTVQWPTVITLTSNLVSYAPDKDDIIYSGMMSEAFNHLQMYEDAGIWDKKFTSKLGEAISIDKNMPDYVPVGRGYDSGSELTYIGEYWNDPFIRDGFL